MSDQTSVRQSKTENEESRDICFGGASGRLSYESRHRVRKKTVGRVILIGGICLLVGTMVAVICVLAYYMVRSNKALYYTSVKALASSEVEQSSDVRRAKPEEKLPTSNECLVNVTPDMGVFINAPEGVMVTDPEPINGLLSAELCEGDVIVSCDDEPMCDAEVLYSIITASEKSEVRQLEVYRDSEYIFIDAVIGE